MSLGDKRNRLPTYVLPIGGEWRRISDKWMRSELLPSSSEDYIALDELIYQYQMNPLAFSLPHGAARKDKHKNDGIAFVNDRESELITLTAGSQLGKAVPVDTKVITPSGEVAIGELNVGDTVFGSDGKPCSVMAVYDQGERELATMTLDTDELTVDSDLEHQWKYMRPKRRSKDRPHYNEWDVVTTKQIIDIQKSKSCGMRGLIPVTEPVRFNEVETYIDPYVMGVLLGDGGMTTASISITSEDKEVVRYVSNRLPDEYEVIERTSKYSYGIKAKAKYKQADGHFAKGKIQEELRRYGLLGKKSECKHVPSEYMFNSVDRRIDVLRGLMDTDGTVHTDGQCYSFSSTSKQLAMDVQWLTRSLGGKAKMRQRQTYYTNKHGERQAGLPSWRVAVKMPAINPFMLRRKADRWEPFRRVRDRVVTGVEMSNRTAECRCITVDSPDSTYLLENFVVTHNTYQGAIKMAMHLCPTDPDWPCFKEHGLEWHEWAGPQKAIVASLKFEPNVRIVWETYLQILPRAELGDLAPSYGCFPHETGNGRVLGFKQGTQVVKLACGSEITLLSYHQNINSFESMQADLAHCDEQPKQQQYDAIAARQRTRGDYTPIWATMTPIIIDGRVDTGAGGFLAKEVMGKKVAKGRKVANYKITVDSMPDVFMSAEKKAQMYEECIGEPTRNNDDPQLRHGRARYFGEPEVGGGGILSAFNPEVHMIEPFNVEKFRPTWMRFVDHGTKPCAGINVAMMPWGDLVIVDEYYEWNPSTRVHAKQLVEDFCGNKRIQVSTYEEDGATWPVYQEHCTNKDYYVSECDGNSFNSPSTASALSIGQVYNQNGFRCTPASHPHREKQGVVDILKDMFALDKSRKHINERIGRPVPEVAQRSGAPVIYMFNHCKNIESEIVGWIEDPKTGKARDADDHLISCMCFMVCKPRRYMGDYMLRVDKETQQVRRVVDEYSRY